MAPEQIKGEGLSLKADVFSFGTILWELATEKIPHFEVSDNLAALTEAITVHGLRPKVPGTQSVKQKVVQA
jgi:serine/threonine protein kinase